LRDWLTLNEALSQSLHENNIESFYQLSRMIFIKDEKYFDKFDLAFASYLDGRPEPFEFEQKMIPKEWLEQQLSRYLSKEEKDAIQALGGLDELLKQFQQRLKEQCSRHQGGNKWIGTGGSSPFGAYGFNPFGIRIGQHESRHQRASKVWDKRVFSNLDEDSLLDSRNMATALKRLTQRRETGERLFDLEETIEKTAKNAGLLQICEHRIKSNRPKVLLLFDVGGSMDQHIFQCQRLFTQARKAFQNLAYFYFHNCPYEALWQDNQQRHKKSTMTFELFRTFSKDTKLIFVGDATMSPYEIIAPFGSVEHMNEESGEIWLKRFLTHFDSSVWLNPLPEDAWQAESVGLIQEIMNKAMFPLTINGLTSAMKQL
jgi:uncharacterized protein with von Willebrand factor type A (vWA) domain